MYVFLPCRFYSEQVAWSDQVSSPLLQMAPHQFQWSPHQRVQASSKSQIPRVDIHNQLFGPLVYHHQNTALVFGPGVVQFWLEQLTCLLGFETSDLAQLKFFILAN